MGTNTITIRECPSTFNRIIVYDFDFTHTNSQSQKIQDDPT